METTTQSTRSNVALKLLKSVWSIWIVITSILGTLSIAGILFVVILLTEGDPSLSLPPLSQTLIEESSASDVIAVVSISGPIMDEQSSESIGVSAAVTSAVKTNRILKNLENNDDVKAVVLRINSPGGTVVGSDEIYRQVKKLRESKPVIASLSDTAASGGYYIAAGATKIVANPATLTGSIGVIAQFPQVSGLFEKLGVELRTIKSGEFKDIGSIDRDLTPAEQQILQTLVDESYAQFVQAIADGRNMEPAKVRQLGDGRVYTGLQAKESGLVDELGSFDDAILLAKKEAQVEEAQVIEYSGDSFWESLLSAKSASLSPIASLERLFSMNSFGVYYLMTL